jgi:hypothetical protein
MRARSLSRRISDVLTGPEASPGERALGWLAAAVAASAQLFWALRVGDWSAVQTLVAVLIAFDIGGGVVVNATRSAKRWWHRPGRSQRRQFGFFVAHAHPFVVAALWPDFSWTSAFTLYTVMLLMALTVMAAPDLLKRPLSFGLGAAGIVLVVTSMQMPAGLAWLPVLYLIKLVMAHAVPES